MSVGLEFYRTLDDTLGTTIAGTCGFGERVRPTPVGLPATTFSERQDRLETFRAFFEASSRIFYDAIHHKGSPRLMQLLLNDAPESYAAEFHRNLPSHAWTTPQFFRTDESTNGEVYELQCPGSGWGDLQLLTNVYRHHLSSDALARYQPSDWITTEILQMCNCPHPSVLHLLDNSSHPVSMRYLIATTQPPLKYWGYEQSVLNRECMFVRSHSFFGLVAENLFKERLKEAGKGRVKFDLPPLLVFDQKITLCLPFLDETRSAFPDKIRSILAYSYPVSENGFRDVDGQWVTIQDFLKRPASRRRYFLKYAGCDVSINWGSRAVFRLNKTKAATYLETAAQDAKRGRCWLIQPEASTKEVVSYFDKKSGDINEEKLTAKYSCFYGPTRLIGIRTMHRHHYKVHGQAETVVGIAVPDILEESTR